MSEKEARQSGGPSRAGVVTVGDVQELMRRKEEIEAQIQANYDVLESQKGVGMNEPLVDLEGYPRSDVDLYQVRTARHNIICLQNDHKAVMKQVEEALHQLHARDKEKQAQDMAEAHKEAMSHKVGQSERHSPLQAFAKVNSISPGSPASIAGLQVDDEIVEFGSVNTHNFQSLQNIGGVVQHSEGKPLNVTVIRRGEKYQLRLVPTRWAGKGLLGCNIIPLQR
ncbi:26S proteasome non-ATPase regulatory subunit 9 isoform X1 [Cynocephalus volans]|uniref:26S proteasome non-ATPase regulatory subunit 9 isoform X1 n=1 Tax=Cynocephalus volans TaxID=110931 RepID=UPI002FCB051C